MGQSPYVKQVVDLQVGQWTPIIAPIDCNVFWIKNPGGNVRETTDQNPNSNSRYELLTVGTLQYLPNYLFGPIMGNYRFKVGDVITNLSADSVPSTVIVTFIA